MKKLNKTLVLISLLMFPFSCTYSLPIVETNATPAKQDKQETTTSISPSNIVNNVDIKILNPENKSDVQWYKKDEKTIIMKVGSEAEITGTVILKNNTKSSNVTWASSDNTVALVNNGKVTAKNIGTTTIIAVSNIDSNYKGILNVEVVNEANFSFVDNESINKVKSIDSYISTSLGNQNNIKMKKGSSVSALSVVTLNDGTKNSNVIWESSDTNIATVDKDGKITTNKVGITTIVSKYKLNPNFKSLITIEVLESIENNSLKENSDIAILPYVQQTPIPLPTDTLEPNILPTEDSTPIPTPIPTIDPLETEYIPANIILAGIDIKETTGNGDNVPNKGEQIYLTPKLTNNGGVSTNALTLKASSTSSYLTIESYYNSASFEKINAGSTLKASSSSIYVTISKDTPPNSVIPITFDISDDYNNKWTVSGSIKTQEINNTISLAGIDIKETTGNGDNVPNKGEQIYLTPKLTNNGGVSTNALTLKASSTSSYLTIESYYNSASFEKINAGSTLKASSSSIYVTISKDTPPNSVIPITFDISDDYNNKWTVSGSIKTQEINNTISLAGIDIKETTGNGDNVPNKGEQIYLTPKLTNNGGVSTNALTLKASSTSSYLTIESYYNSASFEKISAGSTLKASSSSIYVTISKDASPNSVIPITFDISDDYNNKWTVSGSITVR
jgi:hypothetical protein